MMKNSGSLQWLGDRLRTERTRAGLSQDAVGLALGMKAPSAHSYVCRLERGDIPRVAFTTVIRYLQACKAPIGKFMIELVQSGAFGEVEAQCVTGFTSQESTSSNLKLKQEKRAKAKLRYEKRWEREFRDAQVVEALWKEVLPVIQPMFPAGKYYSPMPYLNGVREYYRVWKRVTRQAKGSDPTQTVSIAFDQVEKMGIAARLIPAIVRKVREIVFARLVAGG
jgi:transcriptional regulator with XRE-family HTH domain